MRKPSTSQRLSEILRFLISYKQPGERLPSEPELARQLSVSRATLREAMRSFETQGLITRQQGRGTFVLRPLKVIESGIEVLESIETLARRIGLPVTIGELQVECRPAEKETAQALELPKGTEVVFVSRAILAEDRPVAYLVDILPKDIFDPAALPPDFTGSVLDLLLQRGTPALANSYCEIGAVSADSEVAHALNIQRGDALLRFVAQLYAQDGRVVDYSFSYFLPGYFRFHVVRELGKM